MNRRQFIHGGLMGLSALAMLKPNAAFANKALRLRAEYRTIDVNGKAAKVLGLASGDNYSGYVFEEGQSFQVVLENNLKEPTIIHWHGLTPPWKSDGVADATIPMIAAGERRDYHFPLRNTGTHWMHAHTLQEQALLAAPLIIRSREDMAIDEQDVVILLHDFSFTPAEDLLARLQKTDAHGATQSMQGHAMSGHNMHSGHSMAAPKVQSRNNESHSEHGAMAMDINDIDYDAYLANDRTLNDPEIVTVESGGRIRLRIINGASATGFTIDLGELQGDLIAVDGEKITQPITGRQFPLAMGQRVDIRLQLPKNNKAFPILALREGAVERTGLILRPKGAKVSRLSASTKTAAPILDMSLEEKLRAYTPLQEKPADRQFNVALNGTMEGYVWSMDPDKPIKVRKGERVEITMRNSSMMAHPMHLHGHHFQVVAIDGKRFSGAMRDTVNIAPGRSVTIAVDADNPGQWVFHCHHLYHMVTGMMITFGYE